MYLYIIDDRQATLSEPEPEKSEPEDDDDWSSSSAAAASSGGEMDFDLDDDENIAPPVTSSDSEIDDPVVKFFTQSAGSKTKKSPQEERRPSAEANGENDEDDDNGNDSEAAQKSGNGEIDGESDVEDDDEENRGLDAQNGPDPDVNAADAEMNQSRGSQRLRNQSAGGRSSRSFRIPRSPHASDVSDSEVEQEAAAADNDFDADQPHVGARARNSTGQLPTLSTAPNERALESPEPDKNQSDADTTAAARAVNDVELNEDEGASSEELSVRPKKKNTQVINGTINKYELQAAS